MRIEKEMEVIIVKKGMVMLMLMATQLMVASLAQVEEEPTCWQDISKCLKDSQTRIDFQENCCGTLVEEMTTDEECFCSIKPLLLQNITLDSTVSNMLSICGVSRSFHSICPAKEEEERECWKRIANCVEDNQTPVEFQENCCETMVEEITTEEECFCSVRPLLIQNITLLKTVSNMLSVCNVERSFFSICPVNRRPFVISINLEGAATPASSPSGNIFRAPPALTPITTPAPSQIEVPGASPIVTPSAPSTPSGQDELPCWGRISTCLSGATTETLESCCAVMTEEIDNERECFCGAKPLLEANATVSNGLAQILSFCSISTFDSLCSAGAPSSPGGTTSSPLGPPSPMLFSAPPGTQTSPNGTLIPTPPGTAESMDQSGSNKFVVSVGLLLPQALLVIICAKMILS